MRLSLLYYSPIREQQRRVSRFAITDDHQTRAGEHNKTSNNPYHHLIHSQNSPQKSDSTVVSSNGSGPWVPRARTRNPPRDVPAIFFKVGAKPSSQRGLLVELDE